MTKRSNLEDKIIEYIRGALVVAEKENRLDHIAIEISNHNGNLQMDCILRNREKAY